MEPFLWTHFGNPSSSHAHAQPCRVAVAAARSQVAALLGCGPDEVVFTSCGTEADNSAIYGACAAHRASGKPTPPHVVTTAIEHPAVRSVRPAPCRCPAGRCFWPPARGGRLL